MVDLEEKARLCSVCYKMCRDVCSVAGATRHEADSPHNRGFFAHEIGEGREAMSREVVDYFFRCSMCKACREACETGMDTSEIMLAARRDLDNDLLPERLRAAREAVVSGTYWGEDSPDVKETLAGRVSDTGATPLLLFGGRLRAGSGDAVRSACAVMDRLGVPFRAMEREPSTGQIAHFAGFTGDAKRLAEAFCRAVGEAGAETVVVLCADDLRMIQKEYPALGIATPEVDIVSGPEFLLTILTEKKPVLKKWDGPPVTYHDPCALGRELRVFEAPRDIVRLAAPRFVEMALTRDKAPCCGWGMGLEITHPEITRLTADRLALMAREVGAGTLVTGCPTCRDVMMDNRDENGREAADIEIIDLFQFVERVLP